MQEAESKSAQGDFARAINLYEAALEDSESTRNAEVHYKLALLYDDKLNDPVSALHHFRRYLAPIDMAPLPMAGQHEQLVSDPGASRYLFLPVIVSHTVPFDDVAEALRMAVTPGAADKVVVTFG